ncbi:hypothetical protein BpHYR1_047308 [Brachionus plicatilis]|uniref:Uncharacterized protein n=1 Tax=Brachionus plicatilis TaxID=10195 RepID=A0A3M7T0Q2_BRAPC|nr:hypothetical protein BpHYR1_047308 [Brachionus plicatilis]
MSEFYSAYNQTWAKSFQSQVTPDLKKFISLFLYKGFTTLREKTFEEMPQIPGELEAERYFVKREK